MVKIVVWSLVGLAFAFALFTVTAWTIAAKTDEVGWTLAGNGSLILTVAFATAAAIRYSIYYIKNDD